jgi:hypothetical protein
MNTSYKERLPAGFAGDSRVWIYQSPRLFTTAEAQEIESMMERFIKEWKSHSVPVKGYGNLFFGQFIVLMADETASGVSGCSTDSSVRLIREIEKTFSTPMFDRLGLAVLIEDKVQVVPLAQLENALENHFIDENTLYFDNSVGTKTELETRWIIPLRESWLASKFPLHLQAGEGSFTRK